MRVGASDATAFYGGLADPVFEPERRSPGRELVAVLAPDHFDPCAAPDRCGGLLPATPPTAGVGREDGQSHMDSRAAQRPLPLVWAAVPHVTQLGGARGHALAELGGEASERGWRDAQRTEASVGERHGDRCRGRATSSEG